MKSKKLNTFAIKQDSKGINTLVPVSIPHTLNAIRGYIGCDCIDIATRKLASNGMAIDIILDDEGLLDASKKPTCITLDEKNNIIEYFVGTAILASCDDDGNTIDVEADLKDILKSMALISDKHGNFYQVLKFTL